MAMDELLGARVGVPNYYDQEAKRFRDKADEAEQLAERAGPARRTILMGIAENYRSTADQMDKLAQSNRKPKGSDHLIG